MIRAKLLGLGLALLAGLPARAAPFDTYQVIMWQDHAPAELAGLARLGFTATKLFGTGGRIDPVVLQQRVDSGLPWYVENIGTDFYAPYHRYTPGKDVTWLFDAAKARLRQDPSDTSVFVRDPSLSDPAWLSAIQARLETVVRSQAAFRPIFYNLADEAGIGDLAAAWDADIAQASLAGMRQWLQTQYPDLAALNRQWGTSFAGWDAVMPELTDAALRRTDDNFSAWADFKAWMDVAFARAVRTGRDAVHRADPAALAALEGAQLPGWGGYDYGLLASAVDVMEVYDFGDALELVRAFNPALIPLRTSFGAGQREAHGAWRHLLLGGRGMVVWDGGNDVVLPDGTPGPRGQAIAELAAALRRVAPAIMAAVPSPDPVAVLYSQASFRTRWILDQRGRDSQWWLRDAGREYEDNAWRAARRQVLRRLHEVAIQPRLLSSANVEAGALLRDGIKVLILPHVIALSEAEADAIKEFASKGGTVLADTTPGLFDQHSRRLPAPLLAGIAQLPEAMMVDGSENNTGALEGLLTLLQSAGVTPRAGLRGPDGALAAGVITQILHEQGGSTLLALQSATPWGAPPQIEIQLPAPAMVEDLRLPAPARQESRFTIPLDPVAPTILRLSR